jgi:hypothetical protein
MTAGMAAYAPSVRVRDQDVAEADCLTDGAPCPG